MSDRHIDDDMRHDGLVSTCMERELEAGERRNLAQRDLTDPGHVARILHHYRNSFVDSDVYLSPDSDFTIYMQAAIALLQEHSKCSQLCGCVVGDWSEPVVQCKRCGGWANVAPQEPEE